MATYKCSNCGERFEAPYGFELRKLSFARPRYCPQCVEDAAQTARPGHLANQAKIRPSLLAEQEKKRKEDLAKKGWWWQHYGPGSRLAGGIHHKPPTPPFRR